jgi:hypothetical protein
MIVTVGCGVEIAVTASGDEGAADVDHGVAVTSKEDRTTVGVDHRLGVAVRSNSMAALGASALPSLER